MGSRASRIGTKRAASLGLLDDPATLVGIVLAFDLHDPVAPVDVPDAQVGDLGASGRQERGEHDVVGVGLVHLPAGVGERPQGGEVGDRVGAQRAGGLSDVFSEVAAGTVLGGVGGDDVVADRLVQDTHERGDGVLDRGGRVLGLPLVVGAVDHPGGDLDDLDVPECGQHPQPQTDVVVLGRGGRVQATLPPVADRGSVGGEGDGGVGAGLGGLAHLVEELLDLLSGAYVADPSDALLGQRVGPPHACAEPVDAAFDIGGQPHPDRWATLVRAAGLTSEKAEAVVESETFGALTAELRRAEANLHDLDRLFPRLVAARDLADADDLASVLHHRLARATARPVGSGRTRKSPSLIAGLIPPAQGEMGDNMRHALDEQRELIEQRADAVLDTALDQGATWTIPLGTPPRTAAQRRAWRQQARTVAAYRDRYGITDDTPLGALPASTAQKIDAARAKTALDQASRIINSAEEPTTRRTQERDPLSL